jgi:hypothetical protein
MARCSSRCAWGRFSLSTASSFCWTRGVSRARGAPYGPSPRAAISSVMLTTLTIARPGRDRPWRLEQSSSPRVFRGRNWSPRRRPGPRYEAPRRERAIVRPAPTLECLAQGRRPERRYVPLAHRLRSLVNHPHALIGANEPDVRHEPRRRCGPCSRTNGDGVAKTLQSAFSRRTPRRSRRGVPECRLATVR